MRRLSKRQRTAAVVLATLALCFITLDVGGSSLRSSHDGVRGTLGSAYRGTDALLGPVRRFAEGVPTAGTNRGTINRLQHENAELRGRLAAARAAAKEQTGLDALQRSADAGRHRILPARVTALGSAGGFDWTATLDVGTAGGVQVGQSVTDGHGLVGRVLHADPFSCLVLLAADPGSGAGARDVRTGQVGLATGAGLAGFRFAPLDPHATVRVGDELVTGPANASSFVPGLAVGTVSRVRAAPDGTTTVTVRPTVSPSALDVVGVILDEAAGGTSSGVPLVPSPDRRLASGRSK